MINHIGFIMDGNRRFAKKNSLTLEEGYKKGMEQFLNFVKYQISSGIKETSFFALSNDNYTKRPQTEKKILGALVKEFAKNDKIWDFFKENELKIELKGDIVQMQKQEENMPESDSFLIKKLKERINKHNLELKQHFFKANIAINYDGQHEIVDAVKNIARQLKSGEITLENINANLIKRNLYFSDSPIPEVIVRPGNAPRISGFMLWDSEYSEFYFTQKLWPEMTKEDFDEIIKWYEGLKRNFGK